MKIIAIIFFFLLFLQSHFVYADDVAEWNNLLRIVSGVSEISDPSFFLSAQNKNPKQEMNALLANISSENICKYPARYNYLKEKFLLSIDFSHCENLNSFVSMMQGDSLSIVFVTSHLNTPMSYFGHTFLKINKNGNRFFSNTISYAAEIPKGTGISSLVAKGIGGGFRGRFQIYPYFKVYESYRAIEERGLVEYQLDFTKKEIYNLILHLYEIHQVKHNYLYLSQNCAYELLWLLEVAKPSLELRKELKKYIIPYDTILILNDRGLVKDENFTPSVLSLIYSEYELLSNEGRNALSKILASNAKTNELNTLTLSAEERDRIAFIINNYYDLLFKRRQTVPFDYSEVKSIYYERPVIKTSFEYKYKYPSKFEIGLSNYNGTVHPELKFVPVLFNKDEDYSSENTMLTMEFLALHLTKEERNVKLESFDLINLESFHNILRFYYPLSWRVNIGAKRFSNDDLNPIMKIGLGYMKKIQLFNLYLLAEPGTSVIDTPLFLNFAYGISLNSEKAMTGINAETNLFSIGEMIDKYTYWYLTSYLTKRMSLKFEHHFEDNAQKAYVILRF